MGLKGLWVYRFIMGLGGLRRQTDKPINGQSLEMGLKGLWVYRLVWVACADKPINR